MANEATSGNKFSFPKSERLSHKKAINLLFKHGKSFSVFPLKVLFLTIPEEALAPKVLITVPSKRFKKASDRNIIKRRIREAYRKNKQALIPKNTEHLQVLIAYIYIGNKILDYWTIESKLKETIDRLTKKI